MMQDLAMQFLEIIENSIAADSSQIDIVISDLTKANVISLMVIDNGKGMTKDFINDLTNPFKTSRTTRKVGMGTAFFKQMCDMCQGEFKVESLPYEQTKVFAYVLKDNIDVPPMGDIANMMMTVFMEADKIDINFTYKTDTNSLTLNTKDLKEILEDSVDINNPNVLIWIRDYLKENIDKLKEEE